MSNATLVTDNAPLLERCFLFDAVEADYEVTGIEGRIPSWLRGVYYVNGPARFQRGGKQYNHWLDGDGMICSLRIGNDGVHFRNRFIHTRKWIEEEAAGQFLYRGFGTAFDDDKLRRNVMLESPANVSVYPYDGRLLAFGEQTIPLDLDPQTLETRGEYDFHGAINEVSPFAAHAKIDPSNGHLVNFGISFSSTAPTLNVYEFDAAGQRVHRRRFPISAQHSNHDFGITPNYAIFYLSPLLMDFGRFWNDKLSVMESLVWEPHRGSQILVTPRHGNAGTAFSVSAGSAYCLHMINCFENGNLLTVDLLELDSPVYAEYQPIPDLFPNVAPCRPVRFLIDTARGCIVDRINLDYELSPDFPSIDPARSGSSYDDFWMLGISASGTPGRKFFDQLVHASWRTASSQIYQTEPANYLGGEPLYLGNPHNPSEGVILVEHILPALQKAEILIFDAFNVPGGPVVRIPLKHQIHPGFHTSFSWSKPA